MRPPHLVVDACRPPPALKDVVREYNHRNNVGQVCQATRDLSADPTLLAPVSMWLALVCFQQVCYCQRSILSNFHAHVQFPVLCNKYYDSNMHFDDMFS